MSWDGPTLLDSFERDGEWWLPGDHEGAVAGRVSFDPACGVRLRTFRLFPEERRLETGSGFRPPLILGFWDHGTPVTLFRATRVGAARLPASDRGSEFYARYAIDGHHFHDEGEVAFNSLQAGFTDLEEWAKHHPFEGAVPPPPGEARTGYREMRPVEVNVEALEARLTIRSDLASWGLVPMRTLRWEHRVVFEVEPEEGKPLRWYRDVIRGLQGFLTLMVGRPVYPSAVEAQVHRGGSARPGVFFDAGLRLPENGSLASAVGLSRGGDVLLSLPEIRGELPGMLEDWFARRELLSPVHGLFFGALFGSETSAEFRFLSLAQALESYHRRTKSGSRYESDEQYQRHYEEIVDALPSSLSRPLRQSLKDTLRYGNEWSLRKRVRDLFGEIPEGVTEHGGEYFSGPVVDTRNYLTHYTEELEHQALHGTRLREAVDELGRMLAYFLLKETGLNEETIAAALDKVPRYDYFSLEE